MPVGQVVPVVPQQEPGATVWERGHPPCHRASGASASARQEVFPLAFVLQSPCWCNGDGNFCPATARSAKQPAAFRRRKHAWAQSQRGGSEHPDLLWGFSTLRTVVAPAGTALCFIGVGQASPMCLGLKVMLWSMGSPRQASPCACRRLEAPRTRVRFCPCPSSQMNAQPLAIAIYYGKKNVRRAPGCRNPVLAPHQGRDPWEAQGAGSAPGVGVPHTSVWKQSSEPAMCCW